MSYLEINRRPGLGEREPFPWEPEGPTPEEERAMRAEARWDKTATVIGILGGLLGIVLSVRALRSGD